MDRLQSPIPSDGKTSRKKSNTVWNAEMDNCLLLRLQHQIYRGLKIGNGFKDAVYNVVAAEVSSKFNITVSKDNVMNHLKTLKREYRLVYGLQQKSGFGWNQEAKRLDVCDDLWSPYVEVSPTYLRIFCFCSFTLVNSIVY